MQVGQSAKKRANALARRLESLMKMPPRREWLLGVDAKKRLSEAVRCGALFSADAPRLS
jgi:hypothetical protein